MDMSKRLSSEPDPMVSAAAARLYSERVGYRFIKRAFDIAFSAGALVISSPIIGVTAIAIKIDSPGPVIFCQQRVGKDGKPFIMYKLRSMIANADDIVDDMQDLNEKDGPVFKITNDPRMTRVGKFIRKVSIDEIVQFVNVLKGEMSLVGPRPPLPKEVEQYSPRDMQRLLVKPGITCFWQTTPNRDSVPFNEWVNLDLKYILTCGPFTDLKIIGRTVRVVFNGEGN